MRQSLSLARPLMTQPTARSVFAVVALMTLTGCRAAPLAPSELSNSQPLSTTQTSDCAGGLFASAAEGPVDFSNMRGVVRGRAVTVDAQSIYASERDRTPLTLNLFPDVCLVAQMNGVERDRDQRLIWTGQIEGSGDGATATFVVDGDIVIGSIQAPGPSFYQVRYAGSGIHLILRINPSAFPPD
jgi:hypothetical protein